MSKSVALGFMIGIVLLAVSVSASWQLKTTGQEEYIREMADATPAEVADSAARQSTHRQIYNGFRSGENEPTLPELLATIGGQRIVYRLVVMARRMREFMGSETPDTYFAEFARESDAVIRGTVKNKISQITEDEKFIFTDYGVLVTEVFKNNTASPLVNGSTITLTCPGGKILISDIIVKAGGNSMASLSVNNDVVLFLKFSPGIGVYKLARYTGSFELGMTSIRPLAGQFPPNLLQDRVSFLKLLRQVSN